MRRAGKVVREVLELVRSQVKPGATTLDLERVAEARIKELGAKPAFKGYHGFPCVLCTSINNEVVHGIPSKKRVLKEGDIVSVDCGAIVDGFFGPTLAPKNLATVLTWVHFRGALVLVLLCAGNFFCLACPFMLVRTAARRLFTRGRHQVGDSSAD